MKNLATGAVFVCIAGTLVAVQARDSRAQDARTVLEGSCIRVAGVRLNIELVRTDPERIETLARAKPLKDSGLLIAYGHDRVLYHHTGSDGAACDIAWLGEDGRILETAALAANSEEGVTSKSEARYALAVPAGWLAARRATVGDVVEFSREIVENVPAGLPMIKVGGAAVRVEISEKSPERTRGLMYRKRMSADDGMLFMYAGADPHGFWMGHCYFGLDIAYFDSERKLINVVPMDPYPDPDTDPGDRAHSKAPAQFVLEVNKGWFQARGLVDRDGNAAREIVLELPPAVEALLGEADP